MVATLDDPLVFAAAAMKIANCIIVEESIDLSADEGADFRFVFDIDPGITLSLSCDREADSYLVESKVAAGFLKAHMPQLALRLNHVLARSRRVSIDPANGDLVVSEELDRHGLELDDLAMAVTDLVELACALARAQPQADGSSAPAVDEVVIRA